MRCAVLYVREDSHYKAMPVDCFDASRDARTYAGPLPVVAHPPCRAWGRLRHLAKPRHDERGLALHAVDMVRKFGGVLEHPENSTLWPVAGLPAPGCFDGWGGWTMTVHQAWWGHRAPKPTRLYIVGKRARQIPALPYTMGDPGGRIESMGRREREETPPELAEWLVELAEGCHPE